MSHAETRMRVAGAWLALAAIVLAVSFVFHGPVAPDYGVQMQRIAGGNLRWAAAHWGAAAGLSFFAIASLVSLTAGSRHTRDWWTLSAWALLPVGALWTVSAALAEATVITDAAVAGNRAVYESWWMFAEGAANGFAAMTLAFAVIAASEARAEGAATPAWASSIGAIASLAAFAGWALGMWLGLPFGSPIWLAGAIVMCLWLVWFGAALALVEVGRAGIRRDVPSGG